VGIVRPSTLKSPEAASDSNFLAAAIAADATDRSGWKAYAAGPPLMTETVVAELEVQGMARRDIHADAFLPAPAEAVS